MNVRFALAAGAALLLLSPLARPQGYETALPSDTLLFVGADDVSALRSGFAASAIGRMLEDPGAADLKQSILSLVERFSAEATKLHGVDPVEMLDLVKGRAAFALLGLATPGVEETDKNVVPFDVCLLLDLGENSETFLDKFESLLEKDVESGEVIRRSESEGDVDVSVLLPAAESAPVEFRYGVTATTFFMYVSSPEMAKAGHLADLIESLGGEAENPLSENKAFSDSVASGSGDVRMFVDLNRIGDLVVGAARERGELDESAETILEQLHLSDFKTLAVRGGYREARTVSELELRYGGQGFAARILDAMFSPGKPAQFSTIPADAVSAYYFRPDFGALYDEVLAFVKAISAEGAEEFRLEMEQMKQETGFDLREDLLSSLGNELTLFTAPVDDDTEALPISVDEPLNLAITIALKDGARVRELIENALTASGMAAARKRVEFQGFTVDTLPVPVPIPGAGSLHFAVLDDALALSFSGELLRGVLRRRGESADLATLQAKESVAPAVSAGGASVVAITVSDAAEAIMNVLSNLSALSISQVGSTAGAPIRFEPPSKDVVKKYFDAPNVSVATRTEAGLRVTGTGP